MHNILPSRSFCIALLELFLDLKWSFLALQDLFRGKTIRVCGLEWPGMRGWNWSPSSAGRWRRSSFSSSSASLQSPNSVLLFLCAVTWPQEWTFQGSEGDAKLWKNRGKWGIPCKSGRMLLKTSLKSQCYNVCAFQGTWHLVLKCLNRWIFFYKAKYF